MTTSLRNMMGTLNCPGKTFIQTVGLSESIADISKARKADLVEAPGVIFAGLCTEPSLDDNYSSRPDR